MSITNVLADGFVAVGRGMNEAVDPVLLRNNEVARAVNIDMTSGLARTRPGFGVLPIWTDEQPWQDLAGNDVAPLEYFREGVFQGASVYKYKGQDYVVVVAGQLLWRLNLATHELELYGAADSIEDIPHVNMTTPRCWFCQVEDFMLVQDGINPPWILNGRAIRRSKGDNTAGEIGVDARLLYVHESPAGPSVIPVSPVNTTESFRVTVQMSGMVDDLSVGDYCTCTFRDESKETGIITKIDRFGSPPTYEILFENIRDWVSHGIRRADNLESVTVYHGMTTVGRLEMPEVPAGTVMIYGHGRLFVVRAGRYLVAGDILKSWKPDSVLKFHEILVVSGGGALAVPAEMGSITALSFMQNTGSSTGLGSLLAFCEGGVCAFAIQTPRAQWWSTDISSVVFNGNGAAGPSGVVPVNNDLMFLSWDGLRSLRHTASTVAGSGVLFENRPLSESISTVWDESAQWAWPDSSICHAGGRVYFLSKASRGVRLEAMPNKRLALYDPGPYGEGDEPDDLREPVEEVRFKSVVSLSPVAADGMDRMMVFNGIWTGYDFMQIMSGNLQGHIQPVLVARDHEGMLQFLSMSNRQGNDGDSMTVSRLYTGAYDFLAGLENSSSETLGSIMVKKSLLKRAEYVDVWVSKIYGSSTVRLFARPVGYLGWVECGSFTVSSAQPSVERGNSWPQFRRKQRITIPRLQCDVVTGLDLMTASEFQFCLEWTGGLQVDRALFFATLLPQETNFACRQPQGRVQSATGFNDYDYVAGGDE